MEYLPYSFSKLAVYKDCPKRFFYNYIEKAPQDHMDRTALIKGGAIHSIFEKYPEKSTHKHAERYQHIANKFINSELGQHYLFRESTREYDFGLTRDFKPTKYSDKTGLFRGSIDYICIIDGVLHLIDWKSGKYVQLRWQSFDQLSFYAIYFFMVYPNIDKIKLAYVYIEHGLQNDILLERKYLDNYIDGLMELINNLEKEEDFDKNPSRLCSWCPFQSHCKDDI